MTPQPGWRHADGCAAIFPDPVLPCSCGLAEVQAAVTEGRMVAFDGEQWVGLAFHGRDSPPCFDEFDDPIPFTTYRLVPLPSTEEDGT